MKVNTTRTALLLILCLTVIVQTTLALNDDFSSAVKLIERFYGVKHMEIPFLAKAGMKVITTAARVKGGTARRLAEAGSAKVAIFEDQSFDGDIMKFRTTLNDTLTTSWSPIVQTLSAPNREQCYIFVRNNGDKFNVLVITIDPGDATVVQVTLSAKNLALLMKDPDGMGKAITDEATVVDQ
ncbi:MAG TPA: hypothetical protein VIR01_16950 [Pyrinomonadaceae bacterium]|jgi:hypothetical protein